MRLKYTDDLSAEQVLKEFEVKWKVDWAILKDIDWPASEHNQARLDGHPIDDDLVAAYGVAKENGDEFPRVVLLKVSKKYIIMGGNHRAKADELVGCTEMEAYIVEISDKQTIDLLPRVLNRRGGRRTGEDEAAQHAMIAVKKYGMKQAQAARLFGIHEKAIGKAIIKEEIQERLSAHGVDHTKLPGGTIVQLNQFRHDENTMAEAAKVFAHGKVKMEDSSKVIKKMAEQRNAPDRMKVLSDFQNRHGIKNGQPVHKKTVKMVRQRFMRGLTSFEDMLGKAQTLTRFQITDPEEQNNVAQRLNAICVKCKRLAKGE